MIGTGWRIKWDWLVSQRAGEMLIRHNRWQRREYRLISVLVKERPFETEPWISNARVKSAEGPGPSGSLPLPSPMSWGSILSSPQSSIPLKTSTVCTSRDGLEPGRPPVFSHGPRSEHWGERSHFWFSGIEGALGSSNWDPDLWSPQFCSCGVNERLKLP